MVLPLTIMGKVQTQMKKKKSEWTQFLHKIRFKYRVTVLNENTLEESWHVRLSRFSVFLLSSLFVFLTFSILTALIVLTPIKFYLPGYSSGNRGVIIDESMQVDSLLIHMELQAKYLEVLKGIISGDMPADSLPDKDSVTLKERAEVLIERSKAEQEFVSRYEEEEKFSLSSLGYREIDDVFVFFKPTSGVISTQFNPEDGLFGVSILTATNVSVVSVLEGTVVNTSLTFDKGWVIQIQHNENYLSIYKNNNKLLKKPGDIVKAGEVIAFTGESSEKKTGNQFYFELWKQGKPINPEDVIIF